MRKRKLIKITVVLFLVLLVIWTIWGNVTVGITHYHVTNKRIPYSFNHYKIAQISDLHNDEFGKDNVKLVNKLKDEHPDIIVITGDLVDSNRINLEHANSFIKQAVKIAPCYYVAGNHEAWLGNQYNTLEKELKTHNVKVLHNRNIQLEKNGEVIQLAGIDDPDFTEHESDSYIISSIIQNEIEQIGIGDDYTILLSHRPEAFETYVSNKADLVLSGHAHGGQFRLPFIGGVIAPGQGVFPKYDGGIYSEKSTTMIVSRGLGNSIIPIRVNNRPEVVMIQLLSK